MPSTACDTTRAPVASTGRHSTRGCVGPVSTVVVWPRHEHGNRLRGQRALSLPSIPWKRSDGRRVSGLRHRARHGRRSQDAGASHTGAAAASEVRVPLGRGAGPPKPGPAPRSRCPRRRGLLHHGADRRRRLRRPRSGRNLGCPASERSRALSRRGRAADRGSRRVSCVGATSP